MLLAASVASLVILFASPSLLSMKYSNILLLLGGIVTGAIGLGFWIRRFRMVSLVWLIAGIAIAELAILAAVDHRFRIVVQNSDGVAVDVRDSEMALGHAGSSWGASFIDIREGTKLGKGSIILVCYCGSNVRMNGHFVAIFTIPTGTDLETLNGNLLDGRNGPNM